MNKHLISKHFLYEWENTKVINYTMINGPYIKKTDPVLGLVAKKPYFSSPIFGGIAQLARAFDWQSRGRRFDSVCLHEVSVSVRVSVDVGCRWDKK